MGRKGQSVSIERKHEIRNEIVMLLCEFVGQERKGIASSIANEAILQMEKQTERPVVHETKPIDQLEITYNYCGVCGRQPQTQLDEPNYGPVRYWDPDDGWRIGNLCRHCHKEARTRGPEPGDFAYHEQDTIDINTDDDPYKALT